MSTPSGALLLSCRPLAAGMETTALDRQLCPPVGAQQLKIYTLHASALSVADPASHSSTNAPGDAAGLWTLAFTTVVGLYLVSAHAGAVLRFIRRG